MQAESGIYEDGKKYERVVARDFTNVLALSPGIHLDI